VRSWFEIQFASLFSSFNSKIFNQYPEMEDANSNSPTTAKRAITFQDVYPHGVQLSPDVVQVMEVKSKNREAITFDEVTLEDKPSDFHPNDVRLESWITRKVSLKGCGIMSAAMDTVTERELALEMAKIGGIGILHRNLDAETQAHMVRWVRRKIHYGGMIDKPICFNPSDKYSHLQKMIKVNGWTFTSFPIVDENGKLLGMMTRDEMDFVDSGNPELQQIMKKREAVITAPEGTDTETAYQIMKRQRVKKLPVVDKDDRIIGMYVWNDIKQDHRKRDTFSLDEGGNFLVGAAIGLGIEDMGRVELLVHHGCKLLVMDSSHGACKPAREQIRRIRERYGDSVEIIVGNIASYDSAMYLLDSQWRPDALKVGIGPGSICTTRSVTGHGIPQLTAIYQVWKAIRDYGAKHDYYVPIIADGGLRTSGDIVKALTVGASAIMMGSIFAGTDESPGKLIEMNGKRYKTIRGMGSRGALEERSGSRARYHRESTDTKVSEELTSQQKLKMVPEGVEGLVELKGPVEKVMLEFLGGIAAGLSHSGANNIPDFQKKASLWVQSSAGIIEGKPHDIKNITY